MKRWMIFLVVVFSTAAFDQSQRYIDETPHGRYFLILLEDGSPPEVEMELAGINPEIPLEIYEKAIENGGATWEQHYALSNIGIFCTHPPFFRSWWVKKAVAFTPPSFQEGVSMEPVHPSREGNKVSFLVALVMTSFSLFLLIPINDFFSKKGRKILGRIVGLENLVFFLFYVDFIFTVAILSGILCWLLFELWGSIIRCITAFRYLVTAGVISVLVMLMILLVGFRGDFLSFLAVLVPPAVGFGMGHILKWTVPDEKVAEQLMEFPDNPVNMV